MSTDALAKPLRPPRRGGFVRLLGAKSEPDGRFDGAGRGSAVARAARSRHLRLPDLSEPREEGLAAPPQPSTSDGSPGGRIPWLPDLSEPREEGLAAPAPAEHLGRIPWRTDPLEETAPAEHLGRIPWRTDAAPAPAEHLGRIPWRTDPSVPLLVLGGAAVGTYIGVQVGGAIGAAVGALVGAFVGALAAGMIEAFRVILKKDGSIEIEYETRPLLA